MKNLDENFDAILITGPTASGKSALALRLARERDGVVINADSMQVYDTLRVLTARPSERLLFPRQSQENRDFSYRWNRQFFGALPISRKITLL